MTKGRIEWRGNKGMGEASMAPPEPTKRAQKPGERSLLKYRKRRGQE